MDILIKSFNRPFYLDRCLASIYRFVAGDFSIKVLDDGTPEKYLHKIQAKYPAVTILKSDSYHLKSEAIARNKSTQTEINGNQIPVSFWADAVKKASHYFIITEDDVWFTEPVNVDELQSNAENLNINLIKLGWLGNSNEISDSTSKSISDSLESIEPKDLFLANKHIMKAFFRNDYKFFSLLYKLKLVDNKTKNRYWILNSILMGMYKKEYWLAIWKNMDGKVDEKKQLINASVYFKNHRKNQNFISRLKNEAMKTTFQSSATNSYHQYGYDFDVNLFNYLINEAWLTGNFDSMENFPRDFTTSYFEEFVKDKINVEEFRKWVAQFKNQYRNLGADVS